MFALQFFIYRDAPFQRYSSQNNVDNILKEFWKYNLNNLNRAPHMVYYNMASFLLDVC